MLYRDPRAQLVAVFVKFSLVLFPIRGKFSSATSREVGCGPMNLTALNINSCGDRNIKVLSLFFVISIDSFLQWLNDL